MSERLKKKTIIVTYEARKKADQKDRERSVFSVADVADGGKRKWRKLNYGALSQLTDAG